MDSLTTFAEDSDISLQYCVVVQTLVLFFLGQERAGIKT